LRWYIDSSAIIKLIKLENESKALINALPERVVSSRVARVEVIRTFSQWSPESLALSHEVLSNIEMISIDDAVISISENLPSFVTLRALDSIHIASALSVKASIKGIITYDREMIKAALDLGFKILSPGMK